jgi:Zn-dependent protease with chaperone function
MKSLLVAAVVSVPLIAATPAPAPAKEEKVEGYLEWRQDGLLIVDGQRVAAGAKTRFKGKGDAKNVSSIPLGYEIEANGTRAADGVIHARQLEAKPNGSAMFENEVLQATDQAEQQYRKAGRFFEESERGIQNIGTLYDSGPRVNRVRHIMDRLVPPYLDADQVRVYVIENEEWNAFAMGNYSIYVFSGLLEEMDDDEVAIVLGHELAHATHEHTRRQVKKQMWVQLGALGLLFAAEEIDSKTQRTIAQLVTQLGAVAYSSGYGRDLEDQADRVGLRYAYEGGFDITKGPRLWNRFAEKYGEQGKVVNFFFGDHSLSSKRAGHLKREIALNYRDGPKPARPPRATREPSPTGPGGWNRQSGDEAETVAALAAPGRSGKQKKVEPGMTFEEVRRLLGSPDDQVVFKSKEMWSYPELTVVFADGRVEKIRR